MATTFDIPKQTEVALPAVSSIPDFKEVMIEHQAMVKDGFALLKGSEKTVSALLSAGIDYVNTKAESTTQVKASSPGASIVGLALRSAFPRFHDTAISLLDNGIALGLIKEESIKTLSDDPTFIVSLISKLTGVELK